MTEAPVTGGRQCLGGVQRQLCPQLRQSGSKAGFRAAGFCLLLAGAALLLLRAEVKTAWWAVLPYCSPASAQLESLGDASQ